MGLVSCPLMNTWYCIFSKLSQKHYVGCELWNLPIQIHTLLLLPGFREKCGITRPAHARGPRFPQASGKTFLSGISEDIGEEFPTRNNAKSTSTHIDSIDYCRLLFSFFTH